MKKCFVYIFIIIGFQSCISAKLCREKNNKKEYIINIPNYCIGDTIQHDVLFKGNQYLQFTKFVYDTTSLIPIMLPSNKILTKKSTNEISLIYTLNNKPFSAELWSYGLRNNHKTKYYFKCEFVDIFLDSPEAWENDTASFNLDTLCSSPIIVSFRNELFNDGIFIKEISSGIVLMDTNISSSRYIIAFENILPGIYELSADNGFYGSQSVLRFYSNQSYNNDYDKIIIKLTTPTDRSLDR